MSDLEELEPEGHLCDDCGLPCDCAESPCTICFWCVTVTQQEGSDEEDES
jgi:hypothetical protein